MRSAMWSVLAVAVLAAGASAQTRTETKPSTTGVLTIMSRPVGASFRMVGDREVAGRTPLTLRHGLTGLYVIESTESGYETWRRTIQVDRAGLDTLWITLHPKSRLRAGLRSIILPGWGQFYSERAGWGWTHMIIGVGLATTAGVYAIQYEDRKDEPGRVDPARERMKNWTAAAAGWWAFSSLEAMMSFPDFPRGPVSIAVNADPGGGAEPRVTLAARVKF